MPHICMYWTQHHAWWFVVEVGSTQGLKTIQQKHKADSLRQFSHSRPHHKQVSRVPQPNMFRLDALLNYKTKHRTLARSVLMAEVAHTAFFFPEAALWSMRPGQSKRVRKRNATIDMNLGGARFAGETVKRNYCCRSWITVSNKKHNQARARPATEPRPPPARSPETRARSKQTTKRGDPQQNGRA